MKSYGTLAACALALAACGDGTEEEILSCADLAIPACGGEVAGAWSSVLVCITEEPDFTDLPPECSDTRVLMPTIQANMSLAADGTYELTASSSGSVGYVFSSPCLSALSSQQLTPEATCTQLGAAFEGSEPPFTCTFANEACTCKATYSEQYTEAGTYVISGSTLTMTPTGDVPYTFDYCVEGTELTLSDDTTRMRFVRP